MWLCIKSNILILRRETYLMSKPALTIWWIIVVAFVVLLAYNFWQGNYPEFWWSLIPAVIALVAAIIVSKQKKTDQNK